MASSSFRDSMNSLGWSRSEVPANTAQQSPLLGRLQRLNPFSDEGFVRLPTREGEGPGAPLPARTRREEEEGFFALSRWDRLLLFGGLNLAAVALFIVCFTLLPILSLRPRKFAILWSMASALFLVSWAVMMGPMVYARHLISAERLPFTATYFGSIGLTLYFALGLQSTFLTLISSIVQTVALVWYLVSYFPMGSTGLRFAASFGTSRVMAWMNG
ncbi:Protein transport protein sft2 [Friedmanniomyces endolithicus]|uniref:Protein transport protein SFT2 n=2 Tax=Friedmanniomyces endolithicus TaxID=329885 RepID=A0AAN6FUS6_9PEZI|nr:protein transport protein sft2 [Friedmanniomyces endolithicus]KAK0323706.1 protein transport protein sft2 [Friedmanniomyces endolithicus]KAK0336131.1 Protein transport protein sft2 [Friedmanniomyces endolithicus]KAK0789769.1 Protein transport protein sft2 [Friedmanniomyces endolithicus]KAK0869988.1 Protein transport protein sft2 [Friedmanniomyces endolithicus]